MNRRRMLTLGAAVTVTPLLGPLQPACAATSRDLHFRVLRRGSLVGEHRVAFRADGDHLIVETHVEIAVKLLFITVFRLKHEAREVWRSGRLISVTSTTNRDGVHLKVSGDAVEGGFRIVGDSGPFLAGAEFLTTNSLWDSRIVTESRLIDVQYGGEVGLVVERLGDEHVDSPRGPVRASRYQVITPHYAGSMFYDDNQRWVKALIEVRGETVEYVLAA